MFPRKLGDFTLQAELGRGGSGVVYAALWGHREIALKVLHPEQIATDKFREQFLAEAKRLSELAHPGVVKVLAVGVIDNRPYLAMERLLGETLAERLTRGALPLPLALDLTQQLAAAVSAMHARNLVHRDLKPENVFLVDAQHAVLLDFGIAKDLFAAPSTTTQDGGIRGTPAYMAPERFFGHAAGVATDVYELAVVVYAMIAARLPWDSVTDPSARLDPKPLVEAPPAIDSMLR
nr:serine/threonine protein kinase [Kofleriaceae bacterium]